MICRPFVLHSQTIRIKGGFPMNAVRLALWLSYLLHNIRESWRNYFRTTVDISPSFWCFCVYSIKNFLRSQLFRKFTLSSRLIFAEINSVYQLDWYIKRLENTEMCLCGSSGLFDRKTLCLPVKKYRIAVLIFRHNLSYAFCYKRLPIKLFACSNVNH